jgi:lipopolysaccharide/colanic/teichoic acid biosynthesis glycosyltransferase
MGITSVQRGGSTTVSIPAAGTGRLGEDDRGGSDAVCEETRQASAAVREQGEQHRGIGAAAGEFVWRALELVLCAAMLVLLAPLLAVIALAIKLDSSGPVLFRQERLGRDRKPFILNKFRTMHNGVDHETHRKFVVGLIAGEVPEAHEGGPRFKLADDERVTRVGRLLRRTSLDELPQLWNVLRGEMSLVGPRPPIAYEVDHYPAHWLERFAVKPGLTGLWQVSGRGELTLDEMVELDIQYIHGRSLRSNLAILLRTVPVVLSTRGAS